MVYIYSDSHINWSVLIAIEMPISLSSSRFSYVCISRYFPIQKFHSQQQPHRSSCLLVSSRASHTLSHKPALERSHKFGLKMHTACNVGYMILHNAQCIQCNIYIFMIASLYILDLYCSNTCIDAYVICHIYYTIYGVYCKTSGYIEHAILCSTIMEGTFKLLLLKSS